MKACDGVALTPIKGSTLMKSGAQLSAQLSAQLGAPPGTPASPGAPLTRSYVPPSKQREEAKVQKDLTQEELNSDTVFPTLSAMKPVTNGATWSQLRSRLSQTSQDSPKESAPTLLNVIEERMKREAREKEEGMLRDTITDPFLMTPEEREANGWLTLKVPLAYKYPKELE